MQPSPAPTLLSAFDALPELERAILTTLVLAHEHLNRTGIYDLLRQWGIRQPRGTQISSQDLVPMLEHWQRLGLVVHHADRNHYEMRSAFSFALLERLQAEGKLAELAGLMRQHRPLSQSYWIKAHVLPRELLLSLYLEPADELDRAVQRTIAERSVALGELWLEALGTEPSAHALALLGDPVLSDYLERLLHVAVYRLQAATPAVEEAATKRFAKLAPTAASLVTYYLSLRGEADRALALCTASTGAEGAAMRAFCLLSLGRTTEARAEAKAALEACHAKSSKRFKGLSSPLSAFVCLLLFTADDARGHDLAVAQLRHKAMQAQGHEVILGLEQLAIARGIASAGYETLLYDPRNLYAHGAPVSWQGALLWTLAARMKHTALREEFTEALVRMAELARANAFPWVSAQLAAAHGAHDDGIFTLCQPEDPWEKELRALELELDRATATPEPMVAPTKKSERLAWSLVVSDAWHAVSARIQTRTASGGYTAGRQVSLKTLVEANEGTGWLTDADKPVIACIAPDVAFSRSPYPPPLAVGAEAAELLIGHPCVFADAECTQPVSVVRGTPRVEVVEKAGAIELKLVPAGLGPLPVTCVRESEDRIVVYALGAQQRGLGQLLRRGMRLPSKAQERVSRTLARLGSVFPVASDVAIGDGPGEAERVEADRRLCVDLRPAGAGLSVRVVAAPIEGGPVFAPGEGPLSVLATVEREGRTLRLRCDRDHADERERLDALLESCPSLHELDARGGASLPTRIACLELLCELQVHADSVRVRWPAGRALTVLGERDVRDVRVRLRQQGDLLVPSGELQVDDALAVGLRDLLDRYERREGRFIELEGGQFLALTHRLERALAPVRRLGRAKGSDLTFHPRVADVLFDPREWGSVEGDARVRERFARLEQARASTPELPRDFGAELRPYQLDGFRWMERLFTWGAGACLADDMGLGKTLQTLAVLLAHAAEGPSLVVAPMSVCDNWVSEAAKFAPTLKPFVLAGGDRKARLEDAGPFDVVVCSYGVMQQEIDSLATMTFAVTVLDEAQAIKNASTQRAQAALKLPGERRLALTGTPIENHLGELWTLFAFLHPGLLGSVKQFEETFVRPIQRDQDREAERALKRLIKPFVLRRKKSEVLRDLPEKTEITLHVEPSREEAALFDVLRKQALERLTASDKPAALRMRLLAEIMRLRRAACHPDLVAPDARLASTKLETFEALVMELRAEGHRALVFSQFVDYLSLTRARLDALGIPYQYLDGSSSRAARSDAVTAFQKGEGDLFLISLKAGGFGLNLTSADYVIHLDPWWNPAVEDQASDRAHRIGQTRPVTVYRLLMKGSIEEKILALHGTKRALTDSLLDGTSSAEAISLEELRALLEEPLAPAPRVEANDASTPARARRTRNGSAGSSPK